MVIFLDCGMKTSESVTNLALVMVEVHTVTFRMSVQQATGYARFDQHEYDMTTFNLTNERTTYTKRNVLESMHILTRRSTMNFRRDTENISAAYKSLTSECKH